MSDVIEVTPELTAAQVPPPEFTDSAQSVDALFASAAAPFADQMRQKNATGVRLFAFRPEGTTERVALVFVGPEATKLSRLFVQYADELMDKMEKWAAAHAA